MNKMYFFLVAGMLQSFLVESKDYTLLSRLNNETSVRCNAVEEARWISGDLEYSCDALEDYLGLHNGSYTVAGVRIRPFKRDKSILKKCFRVILSDQDIATKHQEYREFKDLADTLAQERRAKELKAKKERKAKKAEEKLTQF